MTIPLLDTSTPLAGLRGELSATLERVFDSERYILGPEVRTVEQKVAAHSDCQHADRHYEHTGSDR